MKIKFLCAVAALAVAGAAQAAYADTAPTPEITITGDAAIVSQYRFRGISNSDNRPAVQMAITATDKSGFYVSTWGSSTTNNHDTPINTGGTEIDVYGGYSKTIAGYTLDGGVYGYIYPGSPRVDHNHAPSTAQNLFEVYGDVSKSYGPVTAKVGLNWAPKQAAFDGLPTEYSMYEYGNLSYTPTQLPALTVHGEIGHTGGALNYGKEYLDYTVGVGYKWKALTFDVSAVGTNISHADAGSEYYFRPAKTVAVASVTASF